MRSQALLLHGGIDLLLTFFFFLNDTAPPEISPLPLHDALPICAQSCKARRYPDHSVIAANEGRGDRALNCGIGVVSGRKLDRKSTRLNSSHQIISYAVFCLKKKKNTADTIIDLPIRPSFSLARA